MRHRHAAPAGLLGLLIAAAVSLAAQDDPPKAATAPAPSSEDAKSAGSLSTTPAVACRSIDGYEKYEVLPDASITAEEKLLVYYRPLNYRVEKLKDQYHVHLTQDGQVRKRGEKTVLLRKQKLLDYEFKVDYSPYPVFLRNTVALKGLKPGDYEFDIILHDKLAEGQPVVTRTLSFKVVPVVLPKAEVDTGPDLEKSDDRPAPAPAPAPKARPKGKRGKASNRTTNPRNG